MKWLPWPKSEIKFVDVPEGILTESRVWYRTRQHLLQDYAGAVLDYEPLGRLLARSDIWLRSARNLAVWLLPVLLYWRPVVEAVAITVGIFLVWNIIGPSLVSRTISPVMRTLDAVLLQALWYVGWLSRAGSEGAYAVVGIGLAGFVCLRWGIIAFLTRPLLDRVWNFMYRMPVADHILRAFIVRAALRFGVTLKDFAQVEKDIAKHLQRRPRGRAHDR